jgi:RND family efflux transporter MFP subunit
MDTLITNPGDLKFVNETSARATAPVDEGPRSKGKQARRPGVKAWAVSLLALAAVAGGVIAGPKLLSPPPALKAAPAPPSVAVSVPLQRDVAERLELLGQFSAVEQVDLRAQVGGTLTEIGFNDGDIVHKGNLLLLIDPTPYEIKLSSAKAQLEGAKARLDLANQEYFRADSLRKTGYGSIETADQRAAEQRAARSAVDDDQAAIRDAQFDLDHTRIVAPFTGRIGAHQVSTGNLISGSRAGTSPTTLLGTIVSTESIYFNFDMSEADYLQFLRSRQKQSGAPAAKVRIALADERGFLHEGTLDFIDNVLDRSSGTIHARATVPNPDGLLTPGAFARIQVDVAPPGPTLFVPDVSVLPDQSEHIVLTVGSDNVVTPKRVQLGDLRDGLRVIRSGLTPSDRVVVGGIPSAHPGAVVAPHTQVIQVASEQN